MHRLVTLTAASLLAFSLLAADKKKDPDEIGNRDVGKGVNFYSIEKEIALGQRAGDRRWSGRPRSSTIR